MQKNGKSYAFLLSHSSKSKIYIKRVAVSKRLVHFGSLGIFLLIGITTLGLGIGMVISDPAFAESIARASVVTKVAAESINKAETTENSRVSEAADYSFNSGGPEEIDLADGDDTEIDSEVLAMRQNADPAFLPSMWAHLGKINNEFGFRRNPFGGRAYEFHGGMDIDGERGDEVLAPANGTVIAAAYKGGYGNMVEIDHGNGLTSRYGHLSKIEAQVGDTIIRGKRLGLVGSTGRSTGPHLHFELRLNDRPINPRHFLPPEPTDLKAVAR
jgi:murein DD-endopeptidase MepM/ murein hydrolase activator NlpD